MIIQVKQSKTRNAIDLIVTTLGWCFLALFLLNLFRHFRLGFNYQFYVLNLNNTNAILLFTLLSLFIFGSILSGWSFYNKRKFGHLRRRKFPKSASEKEVAAVFLTSEEEVLSLQKETYVERS